MELSKHMADQWAINYINSKSGTAPKPAPAQPQAKTPSFATPTAKPKPVNNPHGQFFSGGLVSKGLDLLRLPEYALTSFAKGNRDTLDKYYNKNTPKGKYTAGENLAHLSEGISEGVKNILPGIQKRTQLGREEGDFNAARDITKNKYAQTAINTGLSLALPSLPVGKVAGVTSKVLTKIPKVEEGINVAQKTGNEALSVLRQKPVAETIEKIPGLEHFRNPEAGKVLTQSTDVTARRVSKLYNQINDAAKGLTKAEREEIGHIIEGKIQSSSAKLNTRANFIRQISDEIGREVVDSGLMSQKSFDKFKGKYLSHIADTVKKDEVMARTRKMLSFTSDSLKQRKDKLGTEGYPDYIREFQFPAFKALSGEIQNVESVKAVRQLADKFGVNVPKTRTLVKNITGPRTTSDGMVYLRDVLPANVRKQFKNIAVPKEVADYITKKFTKAEEGLASKVINKGTNVWKQGKTIYSGPGYHARNIMSNQILSDYSTGAGIPKTVTGYAKAVKAYIGKGDPKMSAYIQEAKDSGLLGRVDISQGVENLKPSVFGKGESKLRKVVEAPQKFQQASEETAKLNVYAFWRNKGLSIKEATKKAEEAIFSPYNINPNERNAVKNVIPFYSFTRQAVPLVGKTAVKKGNTLTKYEKVKTSVEGLSPEGANDNLPDNLKGQIRLPIKDKKGNYTYFDPTYINPAGNFDSSNGGQLPFGLSFNPLATEVASQVFNKDLYFDQPIAKSGIPERANAQRAQHAFQTFAPNMVPTDAVGGIPTGQPGVNLKTRGGSKLYDAFTGQKDYAGRTRSRVQALLDTFGLKSAVYDPNEQQKFDNIDKAAALKELQKERRSVSLDKRLSPADKKQILLQLNNATRTILTR